MTEKTHRRQHNWIIFDEGESATRFQLVDPKSEALAAAAYAACHSLSTLTQGQAFLLCSAVECYQHLATHPAGTKYAVAQLRRLRKAVNQ